MRPGQQVGDYIFDSKLGEGGMAEVWKIRSVSTNDELAMKVLLPEYSANGLIRKRFEREGHIQLVHSQIVPVLRLEEIDTRPALLMPFYPGGSLEARLRPTAAEQEQKIGTPLPVKDTLSISQEILGALDHAHNNQIIHRDVKPDNILFDGLGRAYLSDFGIALDMKRRNVTEPGGELGTAIYSSPEQIRQPRKVDHRTDVYSFGCCLYDMLAGRPPFVSDEMFAIQMAHVSDPPPPLRDFNPEVPDDLSDIVTTALAKDPGDRFQSCAELAKQLRLLEDSGGRERQKDGTIRPGAAINGYRFINLLGRGGMAEVWRVVRDRDDRELAAKILLAEYARNSKIRVRFEREGHISIQHPRLVPVLDLVQFRGRPAIVMPIYPNGSLEARIRKTPHERETGIGKPLSTAAALSISQDILWALDHANNRDIIHRDVKPDNILFDTDNHANLADFGIALDRKRIAVTQAGGDLGTALYISPEQVQNPRSVDHRTDVYSFGCCLFDMVTGRPPFLSDEQDEVAWSFDLRVQHVKASPPSATTLNPQVPEALSALIATALAKDPGERFAECGEFARKLKHFERDWLGRDGDGQKHTGDGIMSWLRDVMPRYGDDKDRFLWWAVLALSATILLCLLIGMKSLVDWMNTRALDDHRTSPASRNKAAKAVPAPHVGGPVAAAPETPGAARPPLIAQSELPTAAPPQTGSPEAHNQNAATGGSAQRVGKMTQGGRKTRPTGDGDYTFPQPPPVRPPDEHRIGDPGASVSRVGAEIDVLFRIIGDGAAIDGTLTINDTTVSVPVGGKHMVLEEGATYRIEVSAGGFAPYTNARWRALSKYAPISLRR